MKELMYKAGWGILFGGVMFSFFFLCLIFVFPTKLQAASVSLVLMTFMQMLFYMYTELMVLNRYYEMMLFDEEGNNEQDTCCTTAQTNVIPTGYKHKISFDEMGNIIKNDEQQCCGGKSEDCHCNKSTDSTEDK